MERMNLQSSKIGITTPVWKNIRDGRIVCGKTIYEALNIGIGTTQDLSVWERVDSLPKEERIVIKQGRLLPRNPIVKTIAALTENTGIITTEFGGRKQQYEIIYCDACKVIVR